MERKPYNGLDAEVISFGKNAIDTLTVWYSSKGCKLGAVALYETDGNNNPMPFGVCWDEDDGYSLDWTSRTGGVTP